MRRGAGALLAAVALAACGNDPWPRGALAENTLFVSFDQGSPRHLDPTSSYGVNENPYVYSIVEPLYQYHYLKRPYELIPRAAAAVVQPRYLDAQGQPLPDDAPAAQVAESVYDIPIRRGLRYAPHPAFALDAEGRPRFHALSPRTDARQAHAGGLRRHRHAPRVGISNAPERPDDRAATYQGGISAAARSWQRCPFGPPRHSPRGSSGLDPRPRSQG